MTNLIQRFILSFVGSTVSLLLVHDQGASAHVPDLRHIKVVLVGDSTVATEQHAPLIDLYRLSRKLIGPMTQAEADRFDMLHHDDAKAEGATATTPDRTHPQVRG